MAWEDGIAESVFVLLDAADRANSKDTAKRCLLQALSSARCIEDSTQRKNLIQLIEDKLKDL